MAGCGAVPVSVEQTADVRDLPRRGQINCIADILGNTGGKDTK